MKTLQIAINAVEIVFYSAAIGYILRRWKK